MTAAFSGGGFFLVLIVANSNYIFKSKYHWSVWLLGLLLFFVLAHIYIDIEDFLKLQGAGKTVYKKLLFPFLFIPLIAYGIIFFIRKTPSIKVDASGIYFGRRFIDKKTIAKVSYKRQAFQFLFAKQQQQTVVVKLMCGSEIVLFSDIYINGRRIKGAITNILKSD